MKMRAIVVSFDHPDFGDFSDKMVECDNVGGSDRDSGLNQLADSIDPNDELNDGIIQVIDFEVPDNATETDQENAYHAALFREGWDISECFSRFWNAE